ncbi:hypothetical protein CALCODRAFT_506412 [Calocera cornea HHB12733]|uniref:Uncharacterized protein n=1 Tax=Calocera cornea HHB12733 TaxID=1353952 RepID=A0A165J0F8_9BASI|nr:hypothetical protein CALCODRAFT_506412 [Calocera cornea HHB12733]
MDDLVSREFTDDPRSRETFECQRCHISLPPQTARYMVYDSITYEGRWTCLRCYEQSAAEQTARKESERRRLRGEARNAPAISAAGAGANSGMSPLEHAQRMRSVEIDTIDANVAASQRAATDTTAAQDTIPAIRLNSHGRRENSTPSLWTPPLPPTAYRSGPGLGVQVGAGALGYNSNHTNYASKLLSNAQRAYRGDDAMMEREVTIKVLLHVSVPGKEQGELVLNGVEGMVVPVTSTPRTLKPMVWEKLKKYADERWSGRALLCHFEFRDVDQLNLDDLNVCDFEVLYKQG